MSHTPGPWTWDGNDLDGPNYTEVIRPTVLCGTWCQGGSVQLKVSEDNARLIASAPKLLSTLEHLLSTLDGVSWSDMEGPSAKAVFAAYMKASEVVEEAKGNKK